MRVFLAGASGVVGRRLIPMLAMSGHEVIAMTHSPEKVESLRKQGAETFVADGLDREKVLRAITSARPEIVIHQMTSLANAKSLRRFDREFALTNSLRTKGTDFLIEGARAAGVRRIIAQSYGNWNYERIGAALKDEHAPFDSSPPANQRESLRAISHCEAAVIGAPGIEGLALRYGNFYGPGSGFSLEGDIVRLVRRRQLPIVGDGAGVWCFVHVDDAASATVAAVTHGTPGAYNVVDDEPAAVKDWLPELARAVSAKPPREVPVWLGRLVVGEVGVSMMTRIRGASNARAKRELLWQPGYKSWREGFWSGLCDVPIPKSHP